MLQSSEEIHQRGIKAKALLVGANNVMGPGAVRNKLHIHGLKFYSGYKGSQSYRVRGSVHELLQFGL